MMFLPYKTKQIFQLILFSWITCAVFINLALTAGELKKTQMKIKITSETCYVFLFIFSPPLDYLLEFLYMFETMQYSFYL